MGATEDGSAGHERMDEGVKGMRGLKASPLADMQRQRSSALVLKCLVKKRGAVKLLIERLVPTDELNWKNDLWLV